MNTRTCLAERALRIAAKEPPRPNKISEVKNLLAAIAPALIARDERIDLGDGLAVAYDASRKEIYVVRGRGLGRWCGCHAINLIATRPIRELRQAFENAIVRWENDQ